MQGFRFYWRETGGFTKHILRIEVYLLYKKCKQRYCCGTWVCSRVQHLSHLRFFFLPPNCFFDTSLFLPTETPSVELREHWFLVSNPPRWGLYRGLIYNLHMCGHLPFTSKCIQRYLSRSLSMGVVLWRSFSLVTWTFIELFAFSCQIFCRYHFAFC